MDPRLPSNPTAMLMQAQDRKNLINKLIMQKSTVDKKEPRQYSHLSTGRVNRRNEEVRKINAQNQQMLKKIMNIMNRKPIENGMKGVPLKRQDSTDDLEEQSYDAFDGNEDIRLVQQNELDAAMAQSRFSFEIMAGASPNKGTGGSSRSPFQQRGPSVVGEEQQRSGCDIVQQNSLHDNSIKIQDSQAPVEALNQLASQPYTELASEQDKIEQMPLRESYQTAEEVPTSVMFDRKLPPSDSEKMAFYPMQQAAREIRLDECENLNQPSVQQYPSQTLAVSKPTGMVKKMYPGQVTLNHVVRKKEVQRINRENKVMLSKLRDIKPTVERTHTQVQHAMKMQQYKRNVSKFHPGGKSQPRPSRNRAASVFQTEPISSEQQQLPDIAGAKNFSQQQTAISARRTSQGNRTYLDAKRDFIMPVTSHIGMRNGYRTNFNSNCTESSVYQNQHTAASTRQETETGVHSSTTQYGVPAPSSLKPHGYAGVAAASSHHDQQNGTNIGSQDSIASGNEQQSEQQQPFTGSQQFKPIRRTSYLQKLKKSPLLSAINQQQGIPRSIVNRVSKPRDDQARVNFRKYGEIPRIQTATVPDHLYKGSISRQQYTIGSMQNNSVMSSIHKQERKSLKVELNRLYNKTNLAEGGQEPIDVQIKRKTPAAKAHGPAMVKKVGKQESDMRDSNPLNDSLMQNDVIDPIIADELIGGDSEDASCSEEQQHQQRKTNAVAAGANAIHIEDEFQPGKASASGDPYSDYYGMGAAIASDGSESNPSPAMPIKMPPASTANFGNSIDQYSQLVPETEVKNMSAMSLNHKSSTGGVSDQQHLKTTEDMMGNQLQSETQQHAQSMPKNCLISSNNYSIPQGSIAEKNDSSDFNDDAATCKVRAQNAVQAEDTNADDQLDEKTPIGIAIKNLNDGSSLTKSEVSGVEGLQMAVQQLSGSNNLDDSSNSMNVGALGGAPTEKNSAAGGGSMVAFGLKNNHQQSGSNASKFKFEHDVTEQQLSRNGGIQHEESEGVSILLTHGTNFLNEKASNQSNKIIQSKENIILSDTSSLKYLDKSPEASENDAQAVATDDK